MKSRRNSVRARRAAITVLSAFLMVIMLGVVAFGIDLGYIVLVRTQLQVAADSAAMAACASMSGTQDEVRTVATTFAGYHTAGGKTISLATSDVEFGTWDATARSFTPSDQFGNAVRVTAKRNDTTGGNKLFFGRVFGMSSFATQASAIAMGNPRDIALVVDLSGSMNDDTEPCWASTESAAAGLGTVSDAMMQQVYTDFGYGTFPGSSQWVGDNGSTGVAHDNSAYANLTKNGGYLTGASIPATYKISSSDSESTRKSKGYKWIIDNQIAVVMPGVKTTPSSGTASSLNYWTKYLDYVIESKSVSGRGTLPPSQDSDRIDRFNNPNNDSFPDATTSVPQGYRDQIGYRTYVQFMMDFGRNVQPDDATYTPMSTSSADCPYHSESTAGGTFSFPPSAQPEHACRRSLIAAIKKIKDRNGTVPDSSQRDWVSVISFDTNAGTVIRTSLTGDYDAAMTSCTTLQAVGDTQASTATETGMIAAKNHIKAASEGGAGREHTQKVIVVLTDGMPNLYTSSSGTISSYRTSNPSSNYYGGSNYAQDSALMQATAQQLLGWKVFGVGIGLGVDFDFMDRMARMGGTASDSGESAHTNGDPSAYETELTNIFENIVENPQVRLVQ